MSPEKDVEEVRRRMARAGREGESSPYLLAVFESGLAGVGGTKRLCEKSYGQANNYGFRAS